MTANSPANHHFPIELLLANPVSHHFPIELLLANPVSHHFPIELLLANPVCHHFPVELLLANPVSHHFPIECQLLQGCTPFSHSPYDIPRQVSTSEALDGPGFPGSSSLDEKLQQCQVLQRVNNTQNYDYS